MPLISAKAIRQPRGQHRCTKCGMGPLGPHLQLYGTPKGGGKPLNIRVHPECLKTDTIDGEPKIAAAIQILKDAAEAAKEMMQ